MSLQDEAMDYITGKKKKPTDEEFKEKVSGAAETIKHYLNHDEGNTVLDLFAFSTVLKKLAEKTSTENVISLAAEIISAQQKRIEAFGMAMINAGMIPPTSFPRKDNEKK